MSFSAAEAVLNSNSIGFAKPSTFNDPFELEAGYPNKDGNVAETLFSGARNWIKRSIWADTSGVLSLTRNPVNPLMWAHYGDEHKGVVIGIDMEKAGFFDVKSCLIPAQFGNVIYTVTRPTHDLVQSHDCDPITVGCTFHYPHGHTDKFQRLFLHKPSCWTYEEEVRVVKCLSDRDSNGENKSGIFTDIVLPNKTLYGYKLPKGSIKEVYFGLRHEFSKNTQNEMAPFTRKYPDVVFKNCYLSGDSWNVEVSNLMPKK